MGHVDISGVEYGLPDGRPLLRDVNLRVGEGSKTALIGPNGTGKTTLIRIIAGDLKADDGAVVRSGGSASCANSSANCAMSRRSATCCSWPPPTRSQGGRRD